MSKAGKISGKEELRQMVERIRNENEALRRLIDAIREQNISIHRKILNK